MAVSARCEYESGQLAGGKDQPEVLQSVRHLVEVCGVGGGGGGPFYDIILDGFRRNTNAAHLITLSV